MKRGRVTINKFANEAIKKNLAPFTVFKGYLHLCHTVLIYTDMMYNMNRMNRGTETDFQTYGKKLINGDSLKLCTKKSLSVVPAVFFNSFLSSVVINNWMLK